VVADLEGTIAKLENRKPPELLAVHFADMVHVPLMGKRDVFVMKGGMDHFVSMVSKFICTKNNTI